MKKRRFCIFLSALLLIAITFVPCVNAYQASSYGTNYYDGMDTRSIAQNARSELSSMGYSSSYYLNEDADDAYNRMASDQVFFFFGHGAPGRILFKESSGDPMEAITADNPSLLKISDYSYSSLHDIALAVYLSCNSANSDATNGNLLDESESKGVDSSVGFSNYITQGQAAWWSDKFWSYLDEQYTLNGAVEWALIDVRLQYGLLNPGGIDSYVIEGDEDIIIDPAMSGS